MCANGRIRHEACLHSRARNLPCHVLLMSIGEDSKSQLGGKHIYRETHGDQRRTAEAARRHLSRQRENDSRCRLLQNVRLHNAHINGTPHLPPPVRSVGRDLTMYTQHHRGALIEPNAKGYCIEIQ